MLTGRTRSSFSPTAQGGTRFTTTSGTADHGDEQTDMEITKDRERQGQEGSRCSHGHLAGQAAGGTAWWAHPPHQGISISLLLPLCLPRCHLCWLSSLGQAWYYPSLVAFHRAAVIRSDSRMLSRLGFQDFSEQRKGLYGYHLILLIFWLQVLKEKSCSNHIHVGNASKRLPSCCMLVRPASWESNLHQQAVLLNCYNTHEQAKIMRAFFSALQFLHSKGQAVLGAELPKKMSSEGNHTGIRLNRPIHLGAISQVCQYQTLLLGNAHPSSSSPWSWEQVFALSERRSVTCPGPGGCTRDLTPHPPSPTQIPFSQTCLFSS